MGKYSIRLLHQFFHFSTIHPGKFLCLLPGMLLPFLTLAQVEVYNQGQAFTCIATDADENIWAGTNKAGIYLLKRADKRSTTPFAKGSFGNLDGYNIQTIAGDPFNAVWVGSNGPATSSASIGGVDEINIKTLAVKHYTHDRNAECYPFFERDGTATGNSICIAADKNGTVWSAHRYHDLFNDGTYILTPGSLSVKRKAATKFKTIGTYEDYRRKNDPLELPYPAYTCNPPVTQTPQSRNCNAVAAGRDGVWLSVSGYLAKNGTFFPARLLKYGLDGLFTNVSVSVTNATGSGGIFNGVCVTPSGNVWATTSIGRVAYFNGSNWQTVTLPASFSTGIIFNANAITSDHAGKVYFGTNKGLVVYNGKTPVADKTFKLYGLADGMPSPNVKGVVAEKNGAVWAATDNGIVKLPSHPFTVYNLIHPVPGRELQAERATLTESNDLGFHDNGDEVEINVAADSSRSTIIVYTGADADKKKMEILYPEATKPEYDLVQGKLIELLRKNDSLVYLYHHPGYVEFGRLKKYQNFTFRLKDSETSLETLRGKLNVYHSPVLMVHGVWSSIGAFEKMENFLLTESKEYEPYQLLRVWEQTTDHPEFVDGAFQYNNRIPDGIDVLLAKCRANGLSAGKVNLVAHSRGGLHARYYLQSSAGVFYRNDVNSLITINTPHSGSQAANLILDERQLFPQVTVGRLLALLFLYNPDRTGFLDDRKGAYELRPEALRLLNSPAERQKNKVKVHAIASRYEFGPNSTSDLLKDIIVNGVSGFPRVGALAFALRLYVLSLGTRCLEGSLDDCMKEILLEENDTVVPYSSQTGGLSGIDLVSDMGNRFAHSQGTFRSLPAVLDQRETHEKVRELLLENIHDVANRRFTKNGFNPVDLSGTYKFLPNLRRKAEGQKVAAGKITISPALKDKTFQYGETVNVTVSTTSAIKRMLIAYEGPSMQEPASAFRADGNFTFPFPVPKEAFGTIRITAYGFDDNGAVDYDTSFINIGLPQGIVLDSIRIQKDLNGQLRVAAGDSVQVGVLGYYSDTVRLLTALPTLNYIFRAGGIASVTVPNRLMGIAAGKTDQLYVGYQGRFDTVSVLVSDTIQGLPVAIPLPVTLGSFTASFQNREVSLFWTTAQEMNNKEFEVQHSFDGARFNAIGYVPGKGTTTESSRYVFSTRSYQSGRNYYRLKQIDLDGNYKYSAVVMVNVDDEKQSLVSLYPNPAKTRIVIGISQPAAGPMQLRLTDMEGRQLWRKTLPGFSPTVPVDLPLLAAGMYLVTISNEKGEKLLTEKLFIQR